MLGKKPAHPTEDELYNHYTARLPDRSWSIAAHLAACPVCARRLRSVLLDRALGALAAGPPRTVDFPAMLREALCAVAGYARPPELKQRLANWIEGPSALAGGVVHWQAGAAGKKQPAQVHLLTTFTGSSPWCIESGVMSGKDFCVTASGKSSGPHALVNLAHPRGLAVHVFHWPPGVAPPLVLLAREVRASTAVVKQTRRHPKLPAQSASFGDLLPGRYLLGLEPVPPPADRQ